MAADPFNSVGGYTIGIPPVPVIDSNGNITGNNIVGNTLNISTNANIGGTLIVNSILANSIAGNITANIVVPGSNTQVLYNNEGSAGANSAFTFNSATKLVSIDGDLIANSITMGYGPLEFCTSRVIFATSSSNGANQVLHRTQANTISSIDYTIIATDAVGNNRQTSKLFASVLGTEVGYFEYGTIDVPQIGPGVGDFRVQYDSANNDVTLTVTPVPSTLVNYRIMTTSYKE